MVQLAADIDGPFGTEAGTGGKRTFENFLAMGGPTSGEQVTMPAHREWSLPVRSGWLS